MVEFCKTRTFLCKELLRANPEYRNKKKQDNKRFIRMMSKVIIRNRKAR